MHAVFEHCMHRAVCLRHASPPHGPGLACELRGDFSSRSLSRLVSVAAGDHALCASCSSGRIFGGRPRLRFCATTFPCTNNSPPHTPHGSRRVSAPSRQLSRTGHSRQNAFAAAMSSSCSEKNSSDIDPLPSLQRARSCQRGSRSVSVSSMGWMANITAPLDSLLGLISCWSRSEGRSVLVALG